MIHQTQLSFDDGRVVHYQSLGEGQHIYSKVDFLSVVFNNASLNEVLSWIHCDDIIVDLALSMFNFNSGYESVFRFQYCGIKLDVRDIRFFSDEGCTSDMFDFICPYIKLDLSGSGLDFLRCRGIEIDSLIRDLNQCPEFSSEGGCYHFTRVDYAFDLINYCPEFLDQLIDHINVNKLPSGRVPVLSRGAALLATIKLASEKTVYLGSPQSDRLLRCYDKRLQHIDRNTGFYVKDNPYGNPDSWIRIEWQLRNGVAQDSIFNPELDHLKIFRSLFDTYVFADGTYQNPSDHSRRPVDFWYRLFDWKSVESIFIQNAKYVECLDPVERCIQSFAKTMASRFSLVISILGLRGLNNLMQDYFDSLNNGQPGSIRRRGSYLNKLNEVAGGFLSGSDLGVYDDGSHVPKFKLLPDELWDYVDAYYAGLLPPLPANVRYELEVIQKGSDD